MGERLLLAAMEPPWLLAWAIRVHWIFRVWAEAVAGIAAPAMAATVMMRLCLCVKVSMAAACAGTVREALRKRPARQPSRHERLVRGRVDADLVEPGQLEDLAIVVGRPKARTRR